MAQTYQEAIQKLQQDSQDLYDKVGGLRDFATEDEKSFWNKLRGIFREAVQVFEKLDNNITGERRRSRQLLQKLHKLKPRIINQPVVNY